MGCRSATPGTVWVFLATFLPLLLCVSSVGAEGGPPFPPHIYKPTFPPGPPFTPGPPITPRPHCRDPEECCEHPFDSEKFNECCEEHGCCPLWCPVTKPGGIIIPTHCNAWECCVHREGSEKHQDCCRRHGCCPDCARVSSGCCYNGVRYAYGSVVQDLSEVCVQLVCSAKLLYYWPFLEATITAVKTCSFTDMREECEGCPVYHCVDEFGLVRMDGEVWHPTPCIQCECRQGHLLCIGFLGPCKPPPRPNCVELPGPCCPTYHCEDGCVDEDGNFRPLGAQWPSKDPCQVMICTDTGIETVTTLCRPAPPPHEGCFPQNLPGQCCLEWNCSRCVDTDGTIHPLHDEWQSGPCIIKVCTITGIVIRDMICPKLGPAPHDTCYKDVPVGKCCEEWKCDGCWDGDVLHPPGSQWPSDDPCVNNVCQGNSVVLRRIDCPDFPRPHESCFEHIPDGACCPTWNCSGCLDEEGTYRPLYHEWQTDPCTTMVCHLNGILTKDVACPPLGSAPHFTCFKATMPGGCCEEWKCDGCIDDEGGFHPSGSVWPTEDPCVTMECLPSGVIQNLTLACLLSPRPHDGCFFQKVEGQCCGEWNCSGCWDDEGNFHQLLDTWTSDPCTTHTCSFSGISTSKVKCESLPKPYHSCKLVVLPNQCCAIWDCKDTTKCIDEEGNVFEDGSEWPAEDSCLVHRCYSGTILTVPIECETMPHPPNCFIEDLEECCPTFNCSGCLDADKVFHRLGDEWKVSPCFLNTCSETGIHEIIIDCPLDPVGCRRLIAPEECCPQWDCSDCMDEFGNLRLNGSVWTSPLDPCTTFTCLNSEIKTSVVECTVSVPPSPICFPSFQGDQCCPTWNCSGCLDQTGEFHDLGESWVVSCVSYTCTVKGISTEDVECPDAPRPGCVPVPPPADGCCPTWSCGPKPLNCSTVKCQGPPWNANCMATMEPGQCCPVYSCRPPNFNPDKPECASVYCRGPPLHQYCMARTPPGQCCPRYSCRPNNTPVLPPKCASVLCMAPPPNLDCTVTTPPGECCPVFDCETSTTTTTTITTTGPPPTSGPPPSNGDCMEDGKHKKNGDVWISSPDGCRRSQCHQGLVIHHYEC